MSATYQIQLTQQQFEDMNRLLEWGREDRSEWMAHHLYDGDGGDQKDDERIVGVGYDEIVGAINDRTALWSSSCGRVELEVPIKVVEEVAVSGDNQPAVVAAIKQHGYLRAQLERMNMEAAADDLAASGLEQFGTFGADRADKEAVMMYTLWQACHSINDEIHTPD